MRLWRQSEEVEILIDQWRTQCEGAIASKSESINKGSHPLAFNGSDKQRLIDQEPLAMTNNRHSEPSRSSLTSTKTELILERLPYITKIEQANPSSGYLWELERVTQFGGINYFQALREETFDDEGFNRPLSAAAQIKSLPATRHLQSKTGKATLKGIKVEEQEVEKLYLSDDDIEG